MTNLFQKCWSEVKKKIVTQPLLSYNDGVETKFDSASVSGCLDYKGENKEVKIPFESWYLPITKYPMFGSKSWFGALEGHAKSNFKKSK